MPPVKKLGKGVEKHINDSIRKVYEESLQEDIPDRFTQLLEQLRQAEARNSGTGDQA